MMTSRFTARKIFNRCFATSNNVQSKYLRVLGIETSCDDTSAAVVDSNKKILGFGHFSQAAIHVQNGGILPLLARDIHRKKIREVVGEAVEKSAVEPKELDAIAVTVKPGLHVSLEVGLEYAKDLCTLYGKPLIPIHHMEAHALTIRLVEDIKFPFLVLLVSGGHCIMAIAESATKFSVLGETVDAAPGMVLDKISRRLKLSNIKRFRHVPGGAAIAALAEKGDPLALKFDGDVPGRSAVANFSTCDFAFSSVYSKTKKYIESQENEKGISGDKLLPNVEDICASVQYRMGKHLCERVEMGMRYTNANGVFGDGDEKVLVVSGGVACNSFFQFMLRLLCDKYNFTLAVPPGNLCTDNGVMIAWNGIERLRANVEPVKTENIHLVNCEIKCELGERLADVMLKIPKGKYFKFAQIFEKMRKESEAAEKIA